VVRHESLDLLRRPVRRATRDVVPRVLRQLLVYVDPRFGDGITYLSEHVRLDTTGRDTVDSDTPLSEVGSKRLDEADNRHLGRVVQSVVLDAEQTSSNGAHKDDTAIVLNILVRRLPNEKLRPCVQIENMIILLLANLLGLIPALGSAVAHDDVDFAERLLRFLE
jgi:hypothetical protein